ncbi:LPS export ABC transporter periplasmic protein LptC [Uliginosibacterium sediminicola]|uniref:LPS export ABC transporter periplasmic protein LptC n=1 Tax=Uliginosibacterium sediminicola TaxID=2024550 RepID=A0ABU9YV71_9RHOO
MNRLSSLFPLLIAALLAISAYWLQRTVNGERGRTTIASRGTPDTIIENFHINKFEADGTLSMSLEGPELKHFPSDDSAELTSPTVRFLRPQRKSEWRSDKAVVTEQGNNVLMTGRVKGIGSASNGEPMYFETESLTLRSHDEVASTNEALRVTQGRERIDAGSGEWDNINGLLKLKQVEATLEHRGP